MPDANVEALEFWERRADAWDKGAEFINTFADAYGTPAIDALAPRSGWRVLDIGSGPGLTAIELARRVGSEGEVVGVDISTGMVAAARRRAEAAGVTNVRFAAVDAQTGALGEDFDAVYSRFGVMFFEDPAAAFSNIGRALRDGGSLAIVVWAALEDNPWMFVPTLAASAVIEADMDLPAPGQPGPFSMADEARTQALLEQAGFGDVTMRRIEGARRISEREAEAGADSLLAIGPLGDAYETAAPDVRRAAVDAVVTSIEPYRTGDGWELPGAALVVTARLTRR